MTGREFSVELLEVKLISLNKSFERGQSLRGGNISIERHIYLQDTFSIPYQLKQQTTLPTHNKILIYVSEHTRRNTGAVPQTRILEDRRLRRLSSFFTRSETSNAGLRKTLGIYFVTKLVKILTFFYIIHLEKDFSPAETSYCIFAQLISNIFQHLFNF